MTEWSAPVIKQTYIPEIIFTHKIWKTIRGEKDGNLLESIAQKWIYAVLTVFIICKRDNFLYSQSNKEWHNTFFEGVKNGTLSYSAAIR